MKVLLYDHSGCLNRGCEAIVRSTVGILRRVFPGCEVGLCSYSPAEDTVLSDISGLTVHGVKAAELTGVKRYINAFNYKLLHTSDYYFKAAYADTVEFAKAYDICLLIGGDTFCYGDNELCRALTKLFKAQGKRLFAWGCSVGSEDLSEEKLKTLRSFDGIFARETYTKAVLDKAGVPGVRVLPDPAFTLEKQELPLPEGWGEHIAGINVSPLVARRCKGLGNYTAALIKYIDENTKYTPVLVPHVLIDGNNDYEFLSAILQASGSKNAILLPDGLTASQYKGYIARTEVFLGARTHSIIGAYSSGVPAFALGYSIKARGIANDLFGNEAYVRGVDKINSAADLIDCFTKLDEASSAMRERLESIMPDYIKASFSAGDELAAMLK